MKKYKKAGLPAEALAEAGQTLLEILLAFGVSVLVLSAVIMGIITSLNNTQYTKNQGLANSYAQQGMAVVRQLRDSSWTNFLTFVGTYCLGPDLINDLDPASPLSLCKQDNYLVGEFGGGSARKIFSREVIFEHNSLSCCSNNDRIADPNCTNIGSSMGSKVTVTVSWADSKCPAGAGNSYCHKVEFITCLSNINSIP